MLPGYPLVNDHIAVPGICPVFNRKYIDSLKMGHPFSRYRYVIVYRRVKFWVLKKKFGTSYSKFPEDTIVCEGVFKSRETRRNLCSARFSGR